MQGRAVEWQVDSGQWAVSRREQLLRRARVSEWSRLPARLLAENPLLLLAIDELLSLALLLWPREQRALWGRLAAFASRALRGNGQ